MTVSQAKLSGEEVLQLLDRYHAASERLQHSHEKLQGEVSRLSAELAHKNELLARRTRLEVLGQMSAGVAHEIRNPLGAIRLYAGLLIRDLVDRPGERRLVEKIIDGVGGMETVVSDLLSFTRGFEPKIRPVCIEDVVDDALESALAVIERRHIDVRLLYQEELGQVRVDPEMLKRAFVNVILNAAQAMGDFGTLIVRTGLGMLEGKPVRTVSFRDTGPGISARIMERLFDPFATDRESGTGLGLAIVQGIVRAHGGKVEAWNSVDGGAIFHFSLPTSFEENEREQTVESVGRKRAVA